MKAHLVLDITIHDLAGYASYPSKAIPLIEKHGGKITHRIGNFEAMEGDWCPQRLLISEFPSKAAAQAFLDDPEYQPVKEQRLSTSTSMLILGESEM